MHGRASRYISLRRPSSYFVREAKNHRPRSLKNLNVVRLSSHNPAFTAKNPAARSSLPIEQYSLGSVAFGVGEAGRNPNRS